MKRVKSLISNYHELLGLIALLLIFSSWLMTSTLQNKFESLDNELFRINQEMTLIRHLGSIESNIYHLIKEEAFRELSQTTKIAEVIKLVTDKGHGDEQEKNKEEYWAGKVNSRNYEVRILNLLFTRYTAKVEDVVATFNKQSHEHQEIIAELVKCQSEEGISLAENLDKNKARVKSAFTKYEEINQSFFGEVPAKNVSEPVYYNFKSKTEVSYNTLLYRLQGMDIAYANFTKLLDQKSEALYKFRTKKAKDLESARDTSFWTYALGTLLIILSKLGEYWRNRSMCK